MKPVIAVATLSLAATAPAAAADLPDGAYGWMAELAGSCWSAVFPDGTRDTQCYSVQYGRYLRGTIELAPGPAASRPLYRGDSVAFWDGETGEIAVHYWSDAGSHGVMTARLDGETIVFARPPRPGGSETRMVWTRTGPDSYRVVQQRREGEAWLDGQAVDYARAGTAP